MGYIVYPVDPDPLVELATGASATRALPTSTTDVVAPVDGIDWGEVYIKVAMSDAAMPPSSALADAPTITISAGSGTPMAIPLPSGSFSSDVTIEDSLGGDMGVASGRDDGNNIYTISILLYDYVPGAYGVTWEIGFLNNHVSPDPRHFVWVVASSEAEAQQPWIHVPTALDFDAIRSELGMPREPRPIQWRARAPLPPSQVGSRWPVYSPHDLCPRRPGPEPGRNSGEQVEPGARSSP